MNDASPAEIPFEYEVVGEHVADPMHLLLLGSDQRYYALSLRDGKAWPTELSDEWVLDTANASRSWEHPIAV